MVTTSTTRIRSMDMPIIDRVFGLEGGYVLDSSNQTFAEFFKEELGVNIDDPKWAIHGGSKAKRLRYYLRRADRKTALETLHALWEYRESSNITQGYPELEDAVRTAFFGIFDGSGASRHLQKCLPPQRQELAFPRRRPRGLPAAC